MGETVLITGGAGFIGRRLCRRLLEDGHQVRVLDSLVEQVHRGVERPPELDAEVELIVGDVRDENALVAALRGVDSVVHLAAEVGVGQSMYQVDRYTSVNDYGTATLFQQLIAKPVRRVVTASSMSIYGEGLYLDQDGGTWQEVERGEKPGPGRWDPLDDQGRALIPAPTPEWKRPALPSVYALGKYVQERLTLTLTRAYGMEGAALRLWNVYGPGQALSNPYTGVLAIFSSRVANGQSPLIFEDGEQRRDFVYVDDVARAFATALFHDKADRQVFNVGSGEVRSVREVAASVARALGREDVEPEITGRYRAGDTRHCVADVSRIEAELGWKAERRFDDGLVELAEWVARQEAEDRSAEAQAELSARGLVA